MREGGVIGGVLILTTLGLKWLWPKISPRRAATEVSRWRPAAGELGLVCHGAGDRLSGAIDGYFVAVHADLAANQTVISVAFWPPLDLGLDLAYEATGKSLEADSRKRGDAVWTADVEWACERVTYGALDVNDEWVTLTTARIEDARDLRSQIRLVTDVAQAIDAERRRLGVPKKIANWEPIWKEMAAKHRFEVSSTPLSMLGSERGFEVRVYARRIVKGVFRVATRAGFKKPLDIGFWARSIGATGHQGPSGTERLTLDDPEFDERFELDAFDRARVVERLEPATRKALVELAETSSIVLVDDNGVEVQTQSPESAAIDRQIAEVCRIAELVDPTQVKAAAAYR
jgi:hypothetical protein